MLLQEVSIADSATRVPELHKKPGSKSQVWNYFGLEKKDGEFQKVTATPADQLSLAESVDRAQRYERKGKKWKELTDVVMFYIAKDCLPLYTVEKPGFKNLVSIFDSRYDLPSRSYFSRTALPELYAEVRDQVKAELEPITYFSATTDLWSSDGSLTPYISYTVHFLNNDWKLFFSHPSKFQYFLFPILQSFSNFIFSFFPPPHHSNFQ